MLRNPDSIPAGDTIIKDPAIEPFFITRPQVGGYVVYEKVVKGENKTPYIKTICYPATFTYALKTVAEQLLNHGEKTNYDSIGNYVDSYKEIQEKILNTVNV